MKPKQAPMFSDGSELPLFSGTPQPASDVPFTPQEVAGRQASLETGCRFCYDTGQVANAFCWCPAGVAAHAACQDGAR